MEAILFPTMARMQKVPIILTTIHAFTALNKTKINCKLFRVTTNVSNKLFNEADLV